LKTRFVAVAISITVMMLLASLALAPNMAQASNNKKDSELQKQLASIDMIAAARWDLTTPEPGGWLFATIGRQPGTDKAWLYVSGFHPEGVAGSSNTTFSAVAPFVKINYYGDVISLKATLNFTSVTGEGETSYILQEVCVNWSLPLSKAQIFNDQLNRCTREIFFETYATISIGANGEHAEFPVADGIIAFLMKQDVVTVAHWNINSPVAGGWVFAASGRSDKQSWLYLAGYHPPGTVGDNNATVFAGLKVGCVDFKESRNWIAARATMKFTDYIYETDTPQVDSPYSISYSIHKVGLKAVLTPNVYTPGCWKQANVDLCINTFGSSGHDVICSSSFATLKF
jgi:hypothetical protein